MGHWQEHFTNLFFIPSVVDETAIDSIPQYALIVELDVLPSRLETDLDINQINTAKALGLDGIPVLQIGGGGESVKLIVFNLI